jgi:hypothetical protein
MAVQISIAQLLQGATQLRCKLRSWLELVWAARRGDRSCCDRLTPLTFEHIARADDAIGRMIGEDKQREMPK